MSALASFPFLMSAAGSSSWSQVSLAEEKQGSMVMVACPLPPAPGETEVEECVVEVEVGRKSTKAAVVASAVLDQEGYYLGPRNELHPSLRGLWCGSKAVTWRRMVSTLQGGRLAGSGAELKRVQNVEVEQALWAATYVEVNFIGTKSNPADYPSKWVVE